MKLQARWRHALPAMALAAFATAALPSAAQASTAVINTNQTLMNVIRANTATTPPPRVARAMGMVGISMFDAVNAASGMIYTPYAYTGGAVSGLNRDAVAYASGYTMMASLFPSAAATLNAELNMRLDSLGISAGTRAASLAFGQGVATDFFNARLGDGSATANIPYTPGTNPGDFQPTNANNPVLPGWKDVQTFSVMSNSQFDVGPPPALGSQEFIDSYNQVKALGCATCGTAEQKLIADFWADEGGTFTPPGHWLDIATNLMGGLSTMQAARLTAMVGTATADAGISAWYTKYTYNVWRPITAINNCTMATCGVEGEPGWTPYLATPNHPSYTSGHSTFSGAGAGALISFFGRDDLSFCTPPDPASDAAGAGDRCFAGFSAAAAEAGISRIYGGIHWEFDNTRAVNAGIGIGKYVGANEFTLLSGVPEPSSWAMLIAGFGFTGAVMRRRKQMASVSA